MRRYLHYRMLGNVGDEKKWLVFIHGAGGSIATWNRQIDSLAPHFNLLLVDLRDHGQSKEIVPA